VTRLIDLPQGATIGSSSLRRQAQVKHLRPDLNVVMFRGNVQTRLKKLADGQVDGTLLALAGLKRLGLEHAVTEILSETEFLPAPGQGAICIEIRENDSDLQALIKLISHKPTTLALICERAFLKLLDGDCRTPLAGHALIEGENLYFKGMILNPDGTLVHAVEDSGLASDAIEIGERAAHTILQKAGKDFFASWA
jgi:hydroxymethylbilane synthase